MSSSIATSAWTPLRNSVFRAFIVAALVSNIGVWMQNVGAAWLMASLTTSPLPVALLQVATSLPVLLFGLPAGAVADIIDRRRLLLITQSWMLFAAAGLSLLTWLNLVNVWILLAFTFALGLGAAINNPAWQAILPEFVPRSQIHAAIALDGVAMNLSRAIGPALAGVLVASAGSAFVFLLNAISYIGVLMVLYQWKRQTQPSILPSERLLSAMRSGVRYLRFAPELQAILIRAGVFISCGSALWALLPALARHQLGLNATGYGILLGCLGAGAVACVAVLPRLKQRLSLDRLVIVGTVVYAVATFALAIVTNFIVLSLVMVLAGVAWVSLLSSLNASVQLIVPQWVQARSLGLYQLTFQGGMAIGSFAWGAVADRSSTQTALVWAAIGLIVGLVSATRYHLKAGEQLNLMPSHHWAEPAVAIAPKLEAAPVLVTLEYQIDPAQAANFIRAMKKLRQLRRRDGAFFWRLNADLANPSLYLEVFIVESWAEHLRQHERGTVEDLAIENTARSFHIGTTPPIVRHLLCIH